MGCGAFTAKEKRMKRHIAEGYAGDPDAEGKAIATVHKYRASKKRKRGKKVSKADKMPGGKGDDKKPAEVDQKQLEMGIKEEMEHTDDKAVAREIAMDHLTEDPNYYSKLKTVMSAKKGVTAPHGAFREAFTGKDTDLKKDKKTKKADMEPDLKKQMGMRRPKTMGEMEHKPSLIERRDALLGGSKKKPTPQKQTSRHPPWAERKLARKRTQRAKAPKKPIPEAEKPRAVARRSGNGSAKHGTAPKSPRAAETEVQTRDRWLSQMKKKPAKKPAAVARKPEPGVGRFGKPPHRSAIKGLPETVHVAKPKPKGTPPPKGKGPWYKLGPEPGPTIRFKRDKPKVQTRASRAPKIKPEAGPAFTMEKKSMTPQELSKAVYDMACKEGDDWLSQFESTSLRDAAVKLCEEEIKLEEQRLSEQDKPHKVVKRKDDIWDKQDKLRIKKQKLALQLAKLKLKARTAKKSDTEENIMGNEVNYEDLFKSEIAESEAEQPLCTCAHCEKPLTKSQLIKGGAAFVASDNSQPHSGGTGDNKTTPARTGGGAKETDNIAPMLKGEDAGDDEEFILSKADLLALSKLDTAEAQEQYMAEATNKRLEAMEKGIVPQNVLSNEEKDAQAVSKSETDGPQPRGGMAHDPAGNSLIQWVQGDDAEIAKAIEKGELGAAGEPSIRTEGSGQG